MTPIKIRTKFIKSITKYHKFSTYSAISWRIFHSFELTYNETYKNCKMQISYGHCSSEWTKKKTCPNSYTMWRKDNRECTIPLFLMPREVWPRIYFLIFLLISKYLPFWDWRTDSLISGGFWALFLYRNAWRAWVTK